MALLRSSNRPRRSARARPAQTTTTTTTTKPSLLSRLTGKSRGARTTTTTTRRTGFGRRQPVAHHQRKASLGDKISGALLKLKGELTHRPGQKAAGTRRMRGTDGRGARAPRAVHTTTRRRRGRFL